VVTWGLQNRDSEKYVHRVLLYHKTKITLLTQVEHFNAIAFTHKNVDLAVLGRLHIQDDFKPELLHSFKKALRADELMFISTCNRVEFIYCGPKVSVGELLKTFEKSTGKYFDQETVSNLKAAAETFENEEAVKHLFAVASSLDSLVIGEREIITQVRKAYEFANNENLSGDTIRLVIKKTLETAKKIYHETQISTKPVSVVSLAYHMLKNFAVTDNARVVMIGAGVTNINFSRFLKKHGFKNFTVFNRTLSKAEKLASDLEGNALPLSALEDFKGGFDVLVSCTGAENAIITKEVYKKLLNGDKGKKILIDLAVPSDYEDGLEDEFNFNMINVSMLKSIAEKNIKERSKEISACETIINNAMRQFTVLYKERLVERALSNVPLHVKALREKAVSTVFAKQIETLDENSKQVIDDILAYMEKKYIGIPMKLAKEITLNKGSKERILK
jgi:glutamyl-tRNA reductase